MKVFNLIVGVPSQANIIPGHFHGAYILRTLSSSEFNYERAKRHLMNLGLGALGSPMMHFNTVAEEETDGVADDPTHIRAQGRLMRLATWVNLDSRFSVSYYSSRYLTLSDLNRLVVLERFSVMSNADEPPTTSQMTRICCLPLGSARLKCSRSPIPCSSMPMPWHLCKFLGQKATQII